MRSCQRNVWTREPLLDQSGCTTPSASVNVSYSPTRLSAIRCFLRLIGAQRHKMLLIVSEGRTARRFPPPPFLMPMPVAMSITARCKRRARGRLLGPLLLSISHTTLVHFRYAQLQEPFLLCKRARGDLLGEGKLGHMAIVCDRFRPPVVWTYKQLLSERLKTPES
jgi:hypothetical protein